MNMKEHILAALREQFDRWEELLAGLSAAQVAAPLLPSPWSVKDHLAHLMAWQQRSIARCEAARLDREPVFAQWHPAVDPASEGDIELTNAWLYQTYRDLPWPRVHQDWRAGFLRFLEASAAISERDLLDAGRYPWLDERPLAFILIASYDHHQEHRENLLAWLSEQDQRLSGE